MAARGQNGIHRRDHRIDLLRGLALASIFINHMPGNRFENWTSRNFGFSDAAEVFVLLAGVAAAFAFFERYATGERRAVTAKVLTRAWTLYAAHLGSTLAALALFAIAAYIYADSSFLDLIGVAPLFIDPLPGIIGIVSGGYQLGYFNILPLYVVLLAMLPGVLWLAARDLRLALAISAALYLAAQIVPLSMPNYPTDGGWYFNPFAWQLIFVIGLCLGIRSRAGKSVPWNGKLFAVALAYVIFSAVWVQEGYPGNLAFGPIPEFVGTLHKSNLPLVRLAHVLLLAYVLVHSPLWAALAKVPRTNPLTRMGRNSLPVFCVGSLLSMVGWLVLVQTGGGLLVDLAVVGGVIGLVALLAWWIERPRVASGAAVQPASVPKLEQLPRRSNFRAIASAFFLPTLR
jgi:hypothetical protein